MTAEQSLDSTTTHRIERLAAGGGAQEPVHPLLATCHAIRRAVFVDEQSVPADLEWDGLDQDAEHFVVFDGLGPEARPLGTARLRLLPAKPETDTEANTEAKAERVAVLTEARGRGLGRVLMAALEDSARAQGRSKIVLNAQVSALRFYEALDYVATGDVLVEAGIDHRAMSKALA